jgi:formate dehydrogenase subunit delta
MNAERLVEMINDIAAFFAADPNHETAVEGVVDHLRKFWDPRMRDAIIEHLQHTGGEGLVPLALDAVKQLAAHPRSVA